MLNDLDARELHAFRIFILHLSDEALAILLQDEPSLEKRAAIRRELAARKGVSNQIGAITMTVQELNAGAKNGIS